MATRKPEFGSLTHKEHTISWTIHPDDRTIFKLPSSVEGMTDEVREVIRDAVHKHQCVKRAKVTATQKIAVTPQKRNLQKKRHSVASLGRMLAEMIIDTMLYAIDKIKEKVEMVEERHDEKSPRETRKASHKEPKQSYHQKPRTGVPNLAPSS